MKKFFSLVLVCALLFTMNVSAFADDSELASSVDDVVIQNLLDQRASCLTDIFSESDQSKINLLIDEINEIDVQLIENGAVFLSYQDVICQFPEAKSDKQLALAGIAGNNSDLVTRVTPPSSNVNSWITYRSTVSSGGTSYDIQYLCAQPTSESSALVDIGSRIVSFNVNWQAGFENLLEVAAEAAIGAVISPIPGADIALLIYDAIHAFASGINTTTEVNIPNITYSWSNTTTAIFTYVKLSNQTDDYQWLSLISTKTSTEVGYMIPKVYSANGSSVLIPDVIQGSKFISAVPDEYNSVNVAINAYNSTGGSTRRTVSSIDITAPDQTQVQTIYPCNPNFPIHCE